MKKYRALLFLLTLIVLITSVVLSGCGDNTVTAQKPTSAPQSTTNQPTQSGDTLASLYPQVDITKPVTIYSYQLGAAPKDLDKVVTEINKILEPETNTSIKINFIDWGDISTKYSLILAAGEDVDLVFTAPWNYYYQEAAKGAFMEITDDFLTKAMPKTKETQVQEAWDSVKINGKIYGVPKNVMTPEHKFVAIREDLREKHNIPALTDWTSYENFLVTIAEKETPVSGIFGIAASINNNELTRIWMQQYGIFDGENAQNGPFAYLYNGGALPKEEDFFVLWDSQYMREFAKRMRYLAEKGCWSQDALSGTVTDDDAFANGQGASIAWNGTVYTYGKLCEKNIPGAVAGYYDLTPDSIVHAENYSNCIMAIASASKYPDRAGMVLDLLKNHTPLYRLYVGGIENEHYIVTEDGLRDKGPAADDYPWDNCGWGIRRDDLLGVANEDPRESTLNATFVPRMVVPPTNGFVFDQVPVKNEMAAVQAIIDEYRPILELGMVEDVDKTIDEMMNSMNRSGLDIVKTEFLNQYKAWLSSR